MADNWANFSNNASGENPVNEVAEPDERAGEDEDWGDFGGFEAAQPGPPELDNQPVPVAGIEASPSPWASFPIAPVGNSASDKPDLLMARSSQPQTHQPPPIDPLADPYHTGAMAPELASQAEASVQQNAQAAASAKSSLDALDISLDDDLLLEGAAAPHPNDLDRLSGGAAAAANLNGYAPNGYAPNNHRSPPDVNNVAPDVQSPGRVAPPSLEAQAAAMEANERIDGLEERLSAADREKLRLQKDRDDLMQRVQELEQEVDGHRVEVEEQRRKYEEIQARHTSELEEIRKAGHDALAVIVEEYKELCKCAVAEQQQTSEVHLQTAITRETERCEQLLKDQHDRLTKVLEEERQKNAEKTQEALELQVAAQKAALEECLQEERIQNKQALEKAVQETQTSCQETLQKALEEERLKGKEQLEGQRVEVTKAMEKERTEHRKTMETVLEEDRQRSKDAIKSALEEERKHQQDVIKQAVETTKEEMQDYHREQRRADSSVRQRSLASLDLFLEGARHQLTSLMTDKPIEQLEDKQES